MFRLVKSLDVKDISNLEGMKNYVNPLVRKQARQQYPLGGEKKKINTLNSV